MDAPDRHVILVIDPDPAIRALILAVLRREGYLAEGADNPDDALQLHRTRKHAAVVVDPRIRAGDSLLHALQTSDGGRKLIVVTTPDQSRQTYAGQPGVRAVLFKPFFLSELAAAVAECCDGS